MAENRTFQFIGAGFDNSDTVIVAKINSTVVYSGSVPSIDAPVDAQLPLDQQSVLFEIANSAVLNTDFAGSLPMTVEVTDGTAIFSLVQCNWYSEGGNVITDPNSGQPDKFGGCYVGNPANSEDTSDTRSSVYIDGVQQVPPLDKSLGVWSWVVPAGSTLSYNWNISIGAVGNVSGNTTSYTGPYTTTAPTEPT